MFLLLIIHACFRFCAHPCASGKKRCTAAELDASLVNPQGLFFWGALFGLQFHALPVQMVLLAALLRLVGSLAWLWGLRAHAPQTEMDRTHKTVLNRDLKIRFATLVCCLSRVQS